jgi:predicted dehydrogenase
VSASPAAAFGEMGEAPVKIGIIGGGMISQICHLPFYLGDPRCEVVRIAESRPSLIRALTQQLGADRVAANHEDVLNDRDIQAVVISAPRPATGPLTLAALEAGKHVLAEKPMAHSVAQARRLAEAARARDLVYAIGFMKRHDPGVQAAKALIDAAVADGRFGRLLLARFYDFSNAYAAPIPPHTRPLESRTHRFVTWPLHPDWLPEAHRDAYAWFLNAGSHDVNLLRLFFPGDVTVLSANCVADASLAATLRHDDAMIAVEVAKCTAGRWIEGAEFLFAHGRVRLVIPSPMAVDVVSEVIVDDRQRGDLEQQVPVGAGWSFARQAVGFVDAVTGKAAPATSGEDGLADMVLTEQIWRKVAGEPCRPT